MNRRSDVTNKYDVRSWGKNIFAKELQARRLGIFLSFENEEALLNHVEMIDDVKIGIKRRHA